MTGGTIGLQAAYLPHEANMSPFDFALIAMFVGITVGGFTKGFLKGVIGLASLVLGLLVAAAWYDELAATLLANMPRQAAKAAAFGGIVGVFGILGAIAGGVANLATKPLFSTLPEFSWVNRILGTATGAAEGVIACAVFVYVMLAIPGTSHMMQESRIGSTVTCATKSVAKSLPQAVEETLTYAWNDLSTGWHEARPN